MAVDFFSDNSSPYMKEPDVFQNIVSVGHKEDTFFIL
jgi:hypothetical protein